MISPRGLYLLSVGAALTLAGVCAFTFGRGFPEYRFGPLAMGFDGYCFWGTVLIGVGGGLFVAGALLHFHPPGRAAEAGPAGGAGAAALLIAALLVGVCVAVGAGGRGSGAAGGAPPMTPEQAVRLQQEMLERQQETLKRLQPRVGFP